MFDVNVCAVVINQHNSKNNQTHFSPRFRLRFNQTRRLDREAKNKSVCVVYIYVIFHPHELETSLVENKDVLCCIRWQKKIE